MEHHGGDGPNSLGQSSFLLACIFQTVADGIIEKQV